jgi:hypothetical protein
MHKTYLKNIIYIRVQSFEYVHLFNLIHKSILPNNEINFKYVPNKYLTTIYIIYIYISS